MCYSKIKFQRKSATVVWSRLEENYTVFKFGVFEKSLLYFTCR